ncbi:hypothetical protein BC830DRAFT_707220 [Chytriomyces sp. MP71]|nr:hypothetical protein BC830DRAFT_707220 [Chytriomyces sp. MP71]
MKVSSGRVSSAFACFISSGTEGFLKHGVGIRHVVLDLLVRWGRSAQYAFNLFVESSKRLRVLMQHVEGPGEGLGRGIAPGNEGVEHIVYKHFVAGRVSVLIRYAHQEKEKIVAIRCFHLEKFALLLNHFKAEIANHCNVFACVLAVPVKYSTSCQSGVNNLFTTTRWALSKESMKGNFTLAVIECMSI